MENNQNNVNVNSAGAAEKKHKTHLAISLSIIAGALVIACIIAIVTVVSSVVNPEGLSFDGSKLNGKTPDELYSDVIIAVDKSNNYTITLTKQGVANAMVTETETDNTNNMQLDVEMHIIAKRDGDNYYYKSSIRKKDKSSFKDSADNLESEIEIFVVDGVAYVNSKGNKFKENADASADLKTFDVLSEIIWEDAKDIFKGAKITEADGGYSVSASNINKKVIDNDMLQFFGEMGTLLKIFQAEFSKENYTIVYDADERPITASYSYDISNAGVNASIAALSGNVKMSADINYGGVSIVKPSDADSYLDASDAAEKQ